MSGGAVLDRTFASAADALAKALPAEVRAECDRILGENAGPRERWSYYDMTLTGMVGRGEAEKPAWWPVVEDPQDDNGRNLVP